MYLLIAAHRPRNSFAVVVDASPPAQWAPVQCIATRQKEHVQIGVDVKSIGTRGTYPKKVLMPCRLVSEKHVQKGFDAMSISTKGTCPKRF